METSRLIYTCAVCICCTKGGDEATDADPSHGFCIEAVPHSRKCDCAWGVSIEADCNRRAVGRDHQNVNGIPVANSVEACGKVRVGFIPA